MQAEDGRHRRGEDRPATIPTTYAGSVRPKTRASTSWGRPGQAVSVATSTTKEPRPTRNAHPSSSGNGVTRPSGPSGRPPSRTRRPRAALGRAAVDHAAGDERPDRRHRHRRRPAGAVAGAPQPTCAPSTRSSTVCAPRRRCTSTSAPITAGVGAARAAPTTPRQARRGSCVPGGRTHGDSAGFGRVRTRRRRHRERRAVDEERRSTSNRGAGAGRRRRPGDDRGSRRRTGRRSRRRGPPSATRRGCSRRRTAAYGAPAVVASAANRGQHHRQAEAATAARVSVHAPGPVAGDHQPAAVPAVGQHAPERARGGAARSGRPW